ncbi:hypothetical protein [Tenacibaculum xiamenense]|uniref:hypothetical protein n=1 Tax=Tenacibaculum xiamenense TaxID=1261553 RepID=UPI0038B4BDDE
MRILKTITLLLFTTTLFNCNTDENPQALSNAEQLTGSWELTSGNFQGNETKFIAFDGNQIQLLFQDELGFKGRFEYDAITNVTETEFTYNIQGAIVYSYTINNNTLTVSESIFNTSAVFRRNSNAPTYENWVAPLTKEEEVNTPWVNATDIEFVNFDGTPLIIGYDSSSGFLASFNLSSLTNSGGVMINRQASALAYDLDGDLFIHSNANDGLLYSTKTDGVEIGSTDLGIDTSINYLSYHNDNIWIASSHAKTIYFDNNNDAIIEEEYVLGKAPYGIEYKQGFLYVSTRDYLHKCQVNGNQLQAVETYAIENAGSIYGITSDGENLWINTQKTNEDDKLIKTNITF